MDFSLPTYKLFTNLRFYLFLVHNRYLPNAGYEISETKRYSTAKRAEACVIATKDWSTGDELRLCTGAIACLNPKEDAELKLGQRDFSVMYSTRKGCSCLFLGPARFFNVSYMPTPCLPFYVAPFCLIWCNPPL